MRSSDGSRARVAGGDGVKRTARTLKIKLARHLLPCHSPVDVGAAETSVLYSSQLWQATGNQQVQASCDRSLFFPDSRTHPQLKQLPAEGWDPHASKRARPCNGHVRHRYCADDGSPRSTSHKQPRAQESFLTRPAAAGGAVPQSTQTAQQQRLESETWDHPVPCWNMGTKRKRGRRSRLAAVCQWARVIEESPQVSSGTSAPQPEFEADPMEMLSMVAAALREQEQQAQQEQQRQEQQQQQQKSMDVDQPVPEVSTTAAAVAATFCREQQQQASSSGRGPVQQQQVWESLVVVGALGCQQAQVQELPPCKAAGRAAAVGKQPPLEEQQLRDQSCKDNLASPVSPVETSQSSDLTCHADSPRPVTVPLTSWPSSSTEGDSDKSSEGGCHAGAGRAGGLHAKSAAAGAKVARINGSSSSESLLRSAQDVL